MVTALRLLVDREVERILILDCDYHYGDGTDRILEACAERNAFEHESFGQHYSEPSQAEDYLKHLERVVADLGSFDLVLYQAGADVHVDDPLGGVLTSSQMRERDRLVFEAAAAQCVPVAWNLAGGYQDPLEKVIVLHRQTMEECVKVFG
jgi:acetoin utilization deacetylase AcuC-like enzyme